MNSSLLALFLDKYPDVWLRFMEHMNMTTMAVLLSIAIGVPLGILITRNKTASNIVIGIANLMQSIPCIALLAFSVPFVGIGEKPAIIMVIIYALLPIIKNTYTGISSIDPKLREAAEGIGLSSWQKLIKVEMPLAMPFIMAGIRISTVAAVGTMTIAAFAGAGGLGWFINMGLIGLNIDMVLLGAIPASVLALLIDYMLAKAENLLVPEGLKPAGQIKNDKLEKTRILLRWKGENIENNKSNDNIIKNTNISIFLENEIINNQSALIPVYATGFPPSLSFINHSPVNLFNEDIVEMSYKNDEKDPKNVILIINLSEKGISKVKEINKFHRKNEINFAVFHLSSGYIHKYLMYGLFENTISIKAPIKDVLLTIACFKYPLPEYRNSDK